MGILNITPDSFSDGGRYMGASGEVDVQGAVRRALEMVAEGVAIIDVGGESTRPGYTPVKAEEEWRRVIPVIQALRERDGRVVISVDTSKPIVADKALEAGADIVNDVQGMRDAAMVEVVRRYRAGAVIMHDGSGGAGLLTGNTTVASGGAGLLTGTLLHARERRSPDRHNKQDAGQETGAPGNVAVMGVVQELAERAADVERAGVPRDCLCLDPGFGFGKRGEANWELLRGLHHLVALGYPVLVGGSRKHFIRSPEEGDAFTAEALRQGAHIIRAHTD